LALFILQNIFESNEPQGDSVVSILEITAKDGKDAKSGIGAVIMIIIIFQSQKFGIFTYNNENSQTNIKLYNKFIFHPPLSRF
jgi:hypothetical protein